MELSEAPDNVGRWGLDDERGTANLITAAVVVRAAELVTLGRVISLAHPIRPVTTAEDSSTVVLRVTDGLRAGSIGLSDAVTIAPHGFEITHVDALGHVFLDGLMWNGRAAAEHVSERGLSFGSIASLAGGLVTRGILLDVADGSRSHLAAGHAITRADLEAAEARQGITVEAGDAVIVRAGLGARDRPRDSTADEGVRTGLAPDCVDWLHRREAAIYGGDCVERLPSDVPGLPMPLHQLGLARMGLVLLDNLAIELLTSVCHELGRWDFLLVCAPLPIEGSTGSAVNPLAIF